MEFKQEELIELEIEITGFLVQGFSLKLISESMGLSKRLLVVHIRNMMGKFNQP